MLEVGCMREKQAEERGTDRGTMGKKEAGLGKSGSGRCKGRYSYS
jgi:hypothetical protein